MTRLADAAAVTARPARRRPDRRPALGDRRRPRPHRQPPRHRRRRRRPDVARRRPCADHRRSQLRCAVPVRRRSTHRPPPTTPRSTDPYPTRRPSRPRSRTRRSRRRRRSCTPPDRAPARTRSPTSWRSPPQPRRPAASSRRARSGATAPATSRGLARDAARAWSEVREQLTPFNDGSRRPQTGRPPAVDHALALHRALRRASVPSADGPDDGGLPVRHRPSRRPLATVAGHLDIAVVDGVARGRFMAYAVDLPMREDRVRAFLAGHRAPGLVTADADDLTPVRSALRHAQVTTEALGSAVAGSAWRLGGDRASANTNGRQPVEVSPRGPTDPDSNSPPAPSCAAAVADEHTGRGSAAMTPAGAGRHAGGPDAERAAVPCCAFL